MAFEITENHQRIFDAVKNKKRNILIQAVAGSGKTTTILKALEFTSRQEKILFLAFNKSIATELSARVPSHVEARTLNALGHRIWGAHMHAQGAGNIKLDANKTMWIAREYCEDVLCYSEGPRNKMAYTVKQLVGLAKSSGLGVEGLLRIHPPSFIGLIKKHDVRWDEDLFTQKEVVKVALAVYELGINDRNRIDFYDQLLMPAIYNASGFRYDRVIVDEAQDLSPLQHALLERSMKKNGQLIAVGDSNQAIYGFRGADSTSMQNLKEKFDMVEMPLSITYRCGKQIVAEAKKIVPHIEAHEDGHEGLFDPIVKYAYDVAFKPGDLVVSRTTAPAVQLCYALIRQRIPAAVLGREIGKGLTKIIMDLNAFDLDDLDEKLSKWSNKERKRLERKESPEHLIQAVSDKEECISVLSEGQDSIGSLLDLIAEMFSGAKSESVVTLCTVHKSKGLEASRVFILNPHLMPHPMAKKRWQKEQEMNLKYVAQTRAKDELHLINLGGES